MAAPAVPFLRNNNNDRLERRLHVHAAVYVLLGASGGSRWQPWRRLASRR
jgi:hypothetical protein